MAVGNSRKSVLRALAGTGLAAGLWCALAAPAASHPHVWIDARSSVVFDRDGKLAAINVQWQFDEYYSTVAIEGLDKNGDGTYTVEELEPVARDNITALKEFRYYTYVKIDGEAPAYGPVTRYKASYSDNMVTLSFTLPLAEPVDPVKRAVTYTMYDPSFYIAIEPAKDAAVSIKGKAPKYCRIDLGKSKADIAEENDTPAESFFAQLGKLDDFGAQYAPPVTVRCVPKTSSQ